MTYTEAILSILKDTKLVLSNADFRHYIKHSGMITKEIEYGPLSGTLHKLAKKNCILKWSQFGRTCTNKNLQYHSYGYSTYKKETLYENKIENIIIELTPGIYEIPGCFHCGQETIYKNFPEITCIWKNKIKLYICMDCREKILRTTLGWKEGHICQQHVHGLV